MTLDDAIAALRQAGQVVQQHNLLSTATDEERRDAIARHIEWWNGVALPVLEAYESMVHEEVAMDENAMQQPVCPRCRHAGEIGRLDLVPGLALVNRIARDGDVDWSGTTQMSWNDQAPEHDPPRFKCLICGEIALWEDLVAATFGRDERKKEGT